MKHRESKKHQETKSEIQYNPELNAIAKKIIKEKLEDLKSQGYEVKVGLEREFMVFDDSNKGREVLNLEELEKELIALFPGEKVIYRVYEEFPLGLTKEPDAFHYPGVRHYEVALAPMSPIAAIEADKKIKDFLGKKGKEWGVALDFRSKPFKDTEIPSYKNKAREKAEENNDQETLKIIDQAVDQLPGINLEFNYSLWGKNEDGNDVNLFYDEKKREGTELFYLAAAGLAGLLDESVLALLSGSKIFAALNPKDDQTVNPFYKGISRYKGAMLRPAPSADEIHSECAENPSIINPEKRGSEAFRLEVRLNDPLQDPYVCMAFYLAAMVYGLNLKKESGYSFEQLPASLNETAKLSERGVVEQSYQDSMNRFSNAELSKKVLGEEFHSAILKNAEKILQQELEKQQSKAAQLWQSSSKKPPVEEVEEPIQQPTLGGQQG